MELEEAYDFMNKIEILSMNIVEKDQLRDRIMTLIPYKNKY